MLFCMKHRSWIALSGFIWFFVGVSLLYKGLVFITEASLGEKEAAILIATGLLIGFIKGRFVLAKTARRVVTRIAQLSLPIRFKDAYAPSYWAILALMMLLGMSFRYLPISAEVRGVIDVAIGSALINGALFYFRAARAIYDKDSPAQSP